MTEKEDIKYWLDKPFRQYIRSLPPKTLPRSDVLEDQFFGQTLRDVIKSSDEKLKTQTQYIGGMGPLGEAVLFGLIGQLRALSSD